MDKEDFVFEKIEVLEWYDGIVRAVGIGHGRWSLIALIAWEIKENRKLYVVLDLDENTKENLRFSLEDEGSKEANWQAFNTAFDEFIKGYKSAVYVIQGDLVVGEKYEGVRVNAAFLSEIIPFNVENALQRECKYPLK